MKTVGWKEWVSLPDLALPSIKAKVDTGARTSVLHTFSVESFQKNNQEYIRFLVHPFQDDKNHIIEQEMPVKDKRIVRDSGGHEEERFVIETTLRIAEHHYPIELTLTNREDMLFRMLLGRTALIAGNFFVNPAKAYLTGKKFSPLKIRTNHHDGE